MSLLHYPNPADFVSFSDFRDACERAAAAYAREVWAARGKRLVGVTTLLPSPTPRPTPLPSASAGESLPDEPALATHLSARLASAREQEARAEVELARIDRRLASLTRSAVAQEVSRLNGERNLWQVLRDAANHVVETLSGIEAQEGQEGAAA